MYKNKNATPGLKWFLALPPLIALDQFSKWWVVQHLKVGEWLSLFPGLQLTLSHNSGIAFSLLNNKEGLARMGLLLFIVLICCYLMVWLVKTSFKEKWTGFSLCLILGGALGNLCDRVTHGYVIDFIDFHLGSWHWYTFNLADSFITVGALMLLKTLFSTQDMKQERSSCS